MSYCNLDEKPTPSVLLVSMPWTALAEPSLGLALLKAVLERKGIPCQVLHVNLFMLQYLQAHSYHALAHIYTLNDFLFTGTLDPVVTSAQQRALRPKVRELVNPRGGFDPSRFGGSEGVVDTILQLRNEIIPPWLEQWADEIANHEASLIGFTCMFDQTIASLALAKMIKERTPNKMIVLGGYAVRSPSAEMIIRSSPWIDAICIGEGETTVIDLAYAATGSMSLENVRGIVFRSTNRYPVVTPSPSPIDLNNNPTPNFDDYFVDIARLSSEYQIDIEVQDLPMENSRGCWWGEKHHCIFCGIRDEDLTYRVRDDQRTLDIMDSLSQKHAITAFRFSDYIMPHGYYETLLPKLIQKRSPYVLCGEIKANVTEEHFARLAKSGFKEVQPGIESFNSGILRKMNKGVSAIQNIFTLVLGRRYDVRIFYNLIYGFPSDEIEEYIHLVETLPRLAHLNAPVTCVPVQITRWAPLQTRPKSFGVSLGEPESHYDLIFSQAYLNKTGFEIDKYCYYFERNFENSTALHRIYDQIVDIVTEWRSKNIQQQAWLFKKDVDKDGSIVIHDGRGSTELLHFLDPPSAEILKACRNPVSINSLCHKELIMVQTDAILEIVNQLDVLGLIFREGDRLVSLVI